ncbi:MAG: glycosyltransferase family 4 protein [Verrucomicrobiales bacterium]|nr:glycosyltransferase family 4 protein [Verrucomicrobiales bacterium]MCP5526601.1 glycosyltransferase family 4 protein [Verrucomicrobiales bacterium]
MKLVVLAHTPPPHHGQSYMVQLLLDGLRSEAEDAPEPIECRHVNVRLSSDSADVGAVRPGKLLRLFGYCLQAIWQRCRTGAPNLYYIPAPPKRGALYRDWLVMLLCRPWFKRVVFHWHAAGLGAWLEQQAKPWEAWLTHRLLGRIDLAITVAAFNQADARRLEPRRILVVENGIPDPCPDFETSLRPGRQRRLAARQRLAQRSDPAAEPGPQSVDEEDEAVVRVLFLAYCTREKGLFDAIEGVVRANAAQGSAASRLRLRLTVAGDFTQAAERVEFERLQEEHRPTTRIEWAGFARGEAKDRLWREADIFCFPTYYRAESFGLVLVEAMAYGLPIVTTRWRSLPDLLPPDYPGLVEPRQPDQIADRLARCLVADGAALRGEFLRRFTRETHLRRMREALRSIES